MNAATVPTASMSTHTRGATTQEPCATATTEKSAQKTAKKNSEKSEKKPPAQQQKMKDCAPKWADYKKEKKVMGRVEYRKFMSTCLKG